VPRTLYRDIIITFPVNENSYFESYLPVFTLPLKLIPVDNIFIGQGLNNGGYFPQMYTKFHAYQYSDADFFIHMDSDTIFREPVTRLDFLDEHNRVYVHRIKFETMDKNLQVWQKPAQTLFMESVPYETTTGFPFVIPRGLYPNAKYLIEKRHKKYFLCIASSVKNFIEFTTLGHYLITNMPETRWKFNDMKSSKVIQSWSWGGFGPNQVTWYEFILKATNSSLCEIQS
jgi:hypothetical protein